MKRKFQFFAAYKNFNTGNVETVDVMGYIYKSIYDSKNRLSTNFYIWDDNYKRKMIENKEDLKSFVKNQLYYHFGSKCEWEYVVIDFPYRTEIKQHDIEKYGSNADFLDINRAKKIDVYQQVIPNINIIVDLLWVDIEKDIKCKYYVKRFIK